LLFELVLLLGEGGDVAGEHVFIPFNTSLKLVDLKFKLLAEYYLGSLLFFDILIHFSDMFLFLLHL